ncbi:MAG: class II fructose-bisphosphate aldolase family protein [Lachnospiraceae bacterium]|jgi:fructose-bisphosphate aldolase class II|nr:class II fructose-bisphosphate aldolase family protein [Lachnospiraceae bacterium]
MLATLKEVLPAYLEEDAAVGAFNLAIAPDIRVLVEAAESLGAPIIMQVGPAVAEFMGYNAWGELARELAADANVPVVMHLDHANKTEPIWKALDAGFSSVMFDGSQLPFRDNVRITREVVERAGRYGASVEAEIGSVAYLGKDTHKDALTDPEEAEAFALESGCDCLAVAVGTTHMMKTQTASIRFELLGEIAERVAVPLVIHGSTGLGDDQLQRLRATHVCKVNIGTALRVAFDGALRAELEARPREHIFLELVKRPLEAEKEVVLEKMRLLGWHRPTI